MNYDSKEKLFGNRFVKNKNKKFKIGYRNKEFNYGKYLNTKRESLNINISLKNFADVSNTSFMFYQSN